MIGLLDTETGMISSGSPLILQGQQLAAAVLWFNRG
jgi:hypothetical protein